MTCDILGTVRKCLTASSTLGRSMLLRCPLSLSGLITLMERDSVRLIGLAFPLKEFRWAAARLAWELNGEPAQPEAAPYAFPVSPEEDRDGDPAPRSGT